ncbi:MAG: DUF4258 domain-containing protein [Thermoflexales bacterium]|nr:DUF4258 domain-containing protein [Thermoflexales bacterium]
MRNYLLTQHAQIVLQKRNIRLEWLERALRDPERTERDAVDPEVEHRLARIPEFDNRMLRATVNATVNPPQVVTAFFERLFLIGG